MLLIFQRFHREICLFLLALFGLACGHLVMTLLEINLQVDMPEIKTESSASSFPDRSRSGNDLGFILQRNLFDPASRGKGMSINQDTSRGDRVPIDSLDGLTLFGTLVAGDDSAAIIKVKKRMEIFRLDQELPNGGRIESIERNRVMIRTSDGTMVVLGLPEEFTEKLNSDARSRQPSQQGSGIVSVGKNSWKVSRGVVAKARENIAEQLRLALLEPRISSNGRTDGFVIKMLNRRSLLVAMGLLRGDVIKTVNDMQLDSPEKALQIMQQLREARRLTVDIERRGKPMTFTYELE